MLATETHSNGFCKKHKTKVSELMSTAVHQLWQTDGQTWLHVVRSICPCVLQTGRMYSLHHTMWARFKMLTSTRSSPTVKVRTKHADMSVQTNTLTHIDSQTDRQMMSRVKHCVSCQCEVCLPIINWCTVCAFTLAGARLWNTWPSDVVTRDTLSRFHWELKKISI